MPSVRPRWPDPIPAAPPSSSELAWSRYRDNLARHLIGIARDLQLRLMRHLVEDRGHRGLRPSFGVLVARIAQSPQPISALARELGISAQATSQLIALAEEGGYLERRPDPLDRRARRPVLTASGQRLVQDALAALHALETEQALQVGRSDHGRFLATLATLVAGIGSPAWREPAPATALRRPSAGLLPILARHVEQSLMRATAARGHRGLKLSHGQILTLVGPSGARLHRLAELHGVSRQAISAIGKDLESLGYVARSPDPDDRRGVVVCLTDRGRRLIEDSIAAQDALEQRWRERIAPADFERFAAVARRLYDGLALERELLLDAFGAKPALAHEGGHATGRADELVRLATRLRDHLGSRDAARLAAHLTLSTDREARRATDRTDARPAPIPKAPDPV